MRRKSTIQKTASDRVFDVVVALLVALILIFTLYPLIYVFSMSISDPIRAASGEG